VGVIGVIAPKLLRKKNNISVPKLLRTDTILRVRYVWCSAPTLSNPNEAPVKQY
jgi:hypothetical protein